MLEQYVDKYIEYLRKVKKSSENTIASYKRDLEKFVRYFNGKGISRIDEVNETYINSYILDMEKNGMSMATISRNIASIKSFYSFLTKENIVKSDPACQIKPPKIVKKAPETLTIGEINRLLDQPSGNSPKEVRDKAMLELFYNLRRLYLASRMNQGYRACNPKAYGCEHEARVYRVSGWE